MSEDHVSEPAVKQTSTHSDVQAVLEQIKGQLTTQSELINEQGKAVYEMEVKIRGISESITTVREAQSSLLHAHKTEVSMIKQQIKDSTDQIHEDLDQSLRAEADKMKFDIKELTEEQRDQFAAIKMEIHDLRASAEQTKTEMQGSIRMLTEEFQQFRTEVGKLLQEVLKKNAEQESMTRVKVIARRSFRSSQVHEDPDPSASAPSRSEGIPSSVHIPEPESFVTPDHGPSQPARISIPTPIQVPVTVSPSVQSAEPHVPPSTPHFTAAFSSAATTTAGTSVPSQVKEEPSSPRASVPPRRILKRVRSESMYETIDPLTDPIPVEANHYEPFDPPETFQIRTDTFRPRSLTTLTEFEDRILCRHILVLSTSPLGQYAAARPKRRNQDGPRFPPLWFTVSDHPQHKSLYLYYIHKVSLLVCLGLPPLHLTGFLNLVKTHNILTTQEYDNIMGQAESQSATLWSAKASTSQKEYQKDRKAAAKNGFALTVQKWFENYHKRHWEPVVQEAYFRARHYLQVSDYRFLNGLPEISLTQFEAFLEDELDKNPIYSHRITISVASVTASAPYLLPPLQHSVVNLEDGIQQLTDYARMKAKINVKSKRQLGLLRFLCQQYKEKKINPQELTSLIAVSELFCPAQWAKLNVEEATHYLPDLSAHQISGPLLYNRMIAQGDELIKEEWKKWAERFTVYASLKKQLIQHCPYYVISMAWFLKCLKAQRFIPFKEGQTSRAYEESLRKIQPKIEKRMGSRSQSMTPAQFIAVFQRDEAIAKNLVEKAIWAVPPSYI